MPDMMDTMVKIRLTAEEKIRAQAQADAAGMTLSAFIRALLSGVNIRSVADTAVLAELRRLGGLVKHAYMSGSDPAATCAALAALQAAAARLAPRQ